MPTNRPHRGPWLQRLPRAARAEAHLLWRLRGDWRAYIIPFVAAVTATSYWRWPDDLIPDRIPLFGRCDDLGVCAVALALARLSLVRRALRPWRPYRTPGEWALTLCAWLVAPAVLRLALGRWPDGPTRRVFRRGMAGHYAPLPPLLRGLALVPQTTPQLRHLLDLAQRHRRDVTDAPLLVPARAPLSIPPHAGNPLLAWTGPDIAFLHFEKAAGTSVLHWLAEHFHPDQIDPDPYRSLPPHLLARTARFPARYALVHGHYDLPGLARLDGPRLLCTVLREPRARILSLYYYWRGVRPEVLAAEDGNHTLALAHRLGLLDFLRSQDGFLRDYIDNCYARRLTGRYAIGNSVDPLAAPDSLAAALAALDTFAVLGVAERLTDSIALLAACLGVHAPLAAPHANAMEDNARIDPRFRPVVREPMTQAIAVELDRLTRLDAVVYDRALRGFHRASGGRDRD